MTLYTVLLHMAVYLAILSPALLPLSTSAQQYPVKPIRLVVPYGPGAGTDTIVRIVGNGIHQRLGQPVVVDNRAGANGMIGAAFVANSPADGYTLLACTTALATNASLYRNEVTYDAVKSFTPISLVVQGTLVLVVNPSLPAKNLKEFIALARSQPGALAYSSYGVGSSPHLAIELFSDMAGIKMVHVPFKGGAAAIAEVISGRVATTFATISAALPSMQSARVRALAVATPKRNARHADIPTIAESGIPGFEASGGWTGVCAPAGVTKEVIGRLYGAISETMSTPDVRTKFTDLGYDIFSDVTPERFAAILVAEVDKWAKVVKKFEIKPE